MIIVLFGVSGAGKSTIGRLLADRLGWLFVEGDDYHPPENIAKMAKGIALNDADRASWLATLAERIRALTVENRSAVLACSALKERYRQQLGLGNPGVVFVHLQGGQALIQQRLTGRAGHFMPPSLLASQFETLEPPSEGLAVDIGRAPEAVATEIAEKLGHLIHA